MKDSADQSSPLQLFNQQRVKKKHWTWIKPLKERANERYTKRERKRCSLFHDTALSCYGKPKVKHILCRTEPLLKERIAIINGNLEKSIPKDEC